MTLKQSVEEWRRACAIQWPNISPEYLEEENNLERIMQVNGYTGLIDGSFEFEAGGRYMYLLASPAQLRLDNVIILCSGD